ncbi:hypothetical protein [Bradyrhizobium sp. CB3481]|uniref:hypothetical protein n=1 Tax=Bradyrhizobium sp. CB3481 TaxID=3039158 RepID=UPI0024B05A5E|nr:hypothetical protein [Bradyrhizobium sp. CB3481]WFU14815.1 hypothetical protein QA643_27690 [Bradyrhizobium sp. CB3481]
MLTSFSKKQASTTRAKVTLMDSKPLRSGGSANLAVHSATSAKALLNVRSIGVKRAAGLYCRRWTNNRIVAWQIES